VQVAGTGPIQQIDLIKTGKFIYATRPGSKPGQLRIYRPEFPSGESLVLR
jgi:hypothetical protein